jgi:ABC-type phosphate transport system substrate-binding protein
MMKNILIALFVVFGSLALATRAQAQAIVIANPSVKSADVSKSDLRDVFTGAASSLKDGSHVTPVLLKSGAAHEEFLSAYVGKNDSAFRAGWRSLVFSGQASMPKSLDSEAAVVEYVAHNAGAIGYIGKGTPHEGVKVLAVR